MECSIRESGMTERVTCTGVSIREMGAVAVMPIPLRRQDRTLVRDTWRRFRRHRLAVIGLVIYLTLVLATLLGPFFWRVGINDLDFGAQHRFSSAHPFGTDDLGRDVLARLLWGGRISIAVGLGAMVVVVTVGVLTGSLAGFFGGRVDMVLSRFIDVFLAVPQLPLLLVVVYLYRTQIVKVLGPELGVFILIVGVIGLLNWMPTARLVRAGFITQREREYVEAARCLGAKWHGLIGHILPNTLSPIIVAGTLSIGAAMLAESTLSFLGLGFPPDVPTWGRMLYDAQNFLMIAPTLAILPGSTIFLAVLSINFIGDGLRDALDPRRAL
jgi:peptide/nickel transport system permease protein